MQKQSKRAVLACARREKAVQLRLAGCTYQQIADGLGVTIAAAWKLVAKAMELSREKTAETCEHLRQIEAQRLDVMTRIVWKDVLAGDGDSIDRCLRIQARRAKLLNLDVQPLDQNASMDVVIRVPPAASWQIPEADRQPNSTLSSSSEGS